MLREQAQTGEWDASVAIPPIGLASDHFHVIVVFG